MLRRAARGPRRGDARGHHRHGLPDRRPPRREPGDGRADHRAARGARARPRDRIVWDVGHQAYGHKLLTGRLDGFGPCASTAGISGFLRRAESEHDVMGAGHACTSHQLRHRARRGPAPRAASDGHVVAVIGDGALTGGMAYEGLNQAGALGSPITVVLNDNGCASRENVGALSKLFQRVRVDPTLTRVREEHRARPRRAARRRPSWAARSATPPSRSGSSPGALFEALGFAYFGPIDGHDIGGCVEPCRRRSRWTARSLVHVMTEQGQGLRAAPRPTARPCTAPRRSSIESGKAAARSRRRPAELHRGLRPRAGRARPSATRASSASPPRCSRAPGCST